MNWNILSASVITLVMMLSWIVPHEEYHKDVYIKNGCEVTGIIWNWETIAGVVGDCKSDRNRMQVELENRMVDIPSQFFYYILGMTWMVSYMFMKSLD